MFNMTWCDEQTYSRLADCRYTKTVGNFSQTDITVFGLTVARMQPNMIGEIGEPDFYWCRRFVKWFI